MGYCSRSKAEELIRAGHVRVNGRVGRDPEMPVQIGRDQIALGEQAIRPEKKMYIAMNKPRGIVTTAEDEKGRDTIYSILEGRPESLPWLAPVGRLDKASEGLLLLTNDSEWGARVAAPETHLGKRYHVQIGALADDGLLRRLEKGVVADGETLRAQTVRLLRSGKKNCWLEIVLDEGKNRQIRRMLAVLGIEVLRLVRVAIGPQELGRIAKGEFRNLTAEEKLAIDREIAAKKK